MYMSKRLGHDDAANTQILAYKPDSKRDAYLAQADQAVHRWGDRVAGLRSDADHRTRGYEAGPDRTDEGTISNQ